MTRCCYFFQTLNFSFFHTQISQNNIERHILYLICIYQGGRGMAIIIDLYDHTKWKHCLIYSIITGYWNDLWTKSCLVYDLTISFPIIFYLYLFYILTHVEEDLWSNPRKYPWSSNLHIICNPDCIYLYNKNDIRNRSFLIPDFACNKTHSKSSKSVATTTR